MILARHKSLLEAYRFIIAGLSNTALTYVIYLIAIQRVSYSVAYAIAYVIGILLSYWLNLRFVFKQTTSWRKFCLFPLVYLIQYILGAMLLAICIEWLAIPISLAPLLVILLTLPITFFCSRFILTAL